MTRDAAMPKVSRRGLTLLTRGPGQSPGSPKRDGRAQYWLQQYLAMGPGRSLRKLAATEHQEGSDKTPAIRTLFRWSTQDGWEEAARRHDAEVAARLQEQTVEDQSRAIGRRRDARLETAAAFRQLISTALIQADYIRDAQGREQIIPGSQRLRRFDEFTPQELAAMIGLHRAAEHTENLIDGLPADRAAAETAANLPARIEPLDEEQLTALRDQFREVVVALQDQAKVTDVG